MIKYIFAIIALSTLSNYSGASPNYVSGSINRYSAGAAGIYVMTSGQVPDNCTGTPYGWLLVPEQNKSLVATVMSMWATQKTSGTFYTNGFQNGYCVVSSVDVNL